MTLNSCKHNDEMNRAPSWVAEADDSTVTTVLTPTMAIVAFRLYFVCLRSAAGKTNRNVR